MALTMYSTNYDKSDLRIQKKSIFMREIKELHKERMPATCDIPAPGIILHCASHCSHSTGHGFKKSRNLFG